MSPARFDEAAIRRVAESHGLDWIYRHSTTSTNADVIGHYRRERREAVAVSDTQTAGRGRRGRQWHSPPGANIYCSLGLFKALPVNRLALLGIVTAVALCRALRAVSGAEVKLKWPNDLLVAGGKLGGILVESQPHDDGLYFFAIGFGINLALADIDFDAIGQPAASLGAAATRALERGDLLIAALDTLVPELRSFDAGAGDLATQFAAYDAFHGKPVEVVDGERRIRGIDRGIAADGQLQIETGDGLQHFSAAEISLRAAER
ncbi:MAG TPA: biotin--[acetyl-CoA-carboxylase] ligase [Gammaproteobacteria bacterium]|nr:biotin--[acetyl-CoA-carboxylase] ligase [Gammaproteobacteria bacterium]